MTTSTSDRLPAAGRPPLVTRPLLLRFATVLGASTSFFLLLSVVPLYAVRSGGDAGLATGALMAATVCGELATPRLVARYGYRLALAVGLVLMGAPALVLTASGGMGWIALVCCARGFGFALTVVAGGALTAALIPPERRGEGLALAGIVSGVPSLVALPLGVWLAAHAGYPPVCVAGGLAALAAVAAVPALPGREARPQRAGGPVSAVRAAGPVPADPADGRAGPRGPAARVPLPRRGVGRTERAARADRAHRADRSGQAARTGRTARDARATRVSRAAERREAGGRGSGVVDGFRTGALARPTAVFTATALGAGVIVTFLPLAVPAPMSGLVAAALFVQPAAATAARWFAGRIGDRRGPAGLVVPGLVLSAAGLAVTAFTGSAAAVLAGVALFGAGFGTTQNATLTLMYSRVHASGYGVVSALWNFGYDAGMGAGAVGFGAAAAGTGYPSAFALTAGLMLLALLPAWRDRAFATPPPAGPAAAPIADPDTDPDTGPIARPVTDPAADPLTDPAAG